MNDTNTPKCKPFLIGISGEKEHGKTTLAKHLEHALPPFLVDGRPIRSTICWEFSDPMIEMAKVLTQDNEFAKDKVYEISPGKPLTGTQVLQLLGTEAVRHVFGMDTWTHYLKKLIDEKGNLNRYIWVIVPSVRMPIEQEMMDYSIWIQAPGVITQQCTNHETEAHHKTLKNRSDLVVTRIGDMYQPSLYEISERIALARKDRAVRDNTVGHDESYLYVPNDVSIASMQ